MANPMEKIYEQYTWVAGLACLYELNVRLEADVVPGLTKYSHESDFNTLEEHFLNHYTSKLTPGEKDLLIKSRQLRNKIIHSDFKSASSKVVEAGGVINPGTVHQMKISSGEVKAVPETTKKEGGIFGWFLEVSSNGTMTESEDLFKRAITLVRKLGHDRAMSEVEKS